MTHPTAPSLFIEDTAAAARVVEAFIFASAKPVSLTNIAALLPPHIPAADVIAHIEAAYAQRGIALAHIDGAYCFTTAPNVAAHLHPHQLEPKKLTRSALETLAIIAYHQPVTRAEIEDIRGVSLARGTLDILMEAGFIRLRGRRKVLGRPLTYGTTPQFLLHFGLSALTDLPGLDELKTLGLIEDRIDPNFAIPFPLTSDSLLPDEEPLEPSDLPELEG